MIKYSNYSLRKSSFLRDVCLVTCFIFFSVNVIAQETKPLELQEVLNLMKRGVPEETLVNRIKELKVNFSLDTSDTAKLARAGASNSLLEVIKENYSKKGKNGKINIVTDENGLTISFPRDGFECGPNVVVKGTSRTIPGKHLWVYAHRSDLSGWWPQQSAVKIKADGSWVQSVNIGGPQDIGFEFEIKAMWVSEAIHREMQQYMNDGVASREWPPIPLPEGGPSKMVTVKKVK
jgi:hypothetical protein